MKELTLWLASGATFLVGMGSYAAIAAPRDGQTGGCTCCLWALGGLPGGLALILVAVNHEAREALPVVVRLALLTLLLIGCAIGVTVRLELKARRERRTGEQRHPDET